MSGDGKSGNEVDIRHSANARFKVSALDDKAGPNDLIASPREIVTSSVDAANGNCETVSALPLIDQVLSVKVPRMAHCSAIEENPNDLPVEEMLAIHRDLLSNGWRPLRWRHPEMGDQELVVTHGFWIWKSPDGSCSGVRWGVKNTLRENPGEIVRSADGVLVVAPKHSDDGSVRMEAPTRRAR